MVTQNTVSIDRVLPNPMQPRKVFDDVELAGLADSIRENGVLQPIVVEESQDGYMILHDGERRLRAAGLAGLERIPFVTVPPVNGSGEGTCLVHALVANLQRADLNPIEEARAYDELRSCGLTIRDISKKVGVYEVRIYNRLKLLALDRPIQDLVASGKFPKDLRVVEALLEIPLEAERVKLAELLAARSPSVKTCILAAKNLAKSLKEMHRIARGVPAVELAQARVGRPVERTKWDALHELGRLPPWAIVKKAAWKTCQVCTLRPMASHQVCGECPAVELLHGMMEVCQNG